MAPKWLHFGNDPSNKRASVLSVVSNNRRSTFEDPEALVGAFSHPFFDQNSIHDVLDSSERLSASDRPVSRKRYSLFARNLATSDGDADRQMADNLRGWPRLFQDKDSSAKDNGYLGGGELTRKNSRRSIVPRTAAKHEPILRWMRRVERSSSSRPSTSSGLRYEASSEAEKFEHEQKKATISAPFNFQHVTHTQPRELPELDFVSDQELSLTFWAASAHQTPQSDLRGIKAEDIDGVHKVLGAESVHDDNLDRVSTIDCARSPSVRESATPVLRATRSLSNASTHSRDDVRRPSILPRSASLASLIAEQRTIPTMVHPAFRSASDQTQTAMPIIPLSSPLSPSGVQTPTSDLNRSLDVVPEESEGQSPVKQPGLHKSTEMVVMDRLLEDSDSFTNPRGSASSTCSEGQETNTTSQYDMSVPSLSSGETWEEDVDFCYNMEAESTCDFQWRHGKNSCASPHDSIFTSSKTYGTDVGSLYDTSPRMSFAQAFAQRPVSRLSANVTPMLSSPEFASRWEAGAFENPRAAPGAPDATLPEINRLSSFFDLPILQPETAQAESGFNTEGSSPTTPSAAKQFSTSSTSTSPRASTEGLSSKQDANQLSSRPSSHGGLPSPPPTVPLPPLPTEFKPMRGSTLAKRATVAGRASSNNATDHLLTAGDKALAHTTRGMQSLKSALPVRLRASRSVEGPALRDKMSRSVSSPSVNTLYEAHAIPKTAEKFPVWI